MAIDYTKTAEGAGLYPMAAFPLGATDPRVDLQLGHLNLAGQVGGVSRSATALSPVLKLLLDTGVADLGLQVGAGLFPMGSFPLGGIDPHPELSLGHVSLVPQVGTTFTGVVVAAAAGKLQFTGQAFNPCNLTGAGLSPMGAFPLGAGDTHPELSLGHLNFLTPPGTVLTGVVVAPPVAHLSIIAHPYDPPSSLGAGLGPMGAMPVGAGPLPEGWVLANGWRRELDIVGLTPIVHTDAICVGSPVATLSLVGDDGTEHAGSTPTEPFAVQLTTIGYEPTIYADATVIAPQGQHIVLGRDGIGFTGNFAAGDSGYFWWRARDGVTYSENNIKGVPVARMSAPGLLGIVQIDSNAIGDGETDIGLAEMDGVDGVGSAGSTGVCASTSLTITTFLPSRITAGKTPHTTGGAGFAPTGAMPMGGRPMDAGEAFAVSVYGLKVSVAGLTPIVHAEHIIASGKPRVMQLVGDPGVEHADAIGSSGPAVMKVTGFRPTYTRTSTIVAPISSVALIGKDGIGFSGNIAAGLLAAVRLEPKTGASSADANVSAGVGNLSLVTVQASSSGTSNAGWTTAIVSLAGAHGVGSAGSTPVGQTDSLTIKPIAVDKVVAGKTPHGTGETGFWPLGGSVLGEGPLPQGWVLANGWKSTIAVTGKPGLAKADVNILPAAGVASMSGLVPMVIATVSTVPGPVEVETIVGEDGVGSASSTAATSQVGSLLIGGDLPELLSSNLVVAPVAVIPLAGRDGTARCSVRVIDDATPVETIIPQTGSTTASSGPTGAAGELDALGQLASLFYVNTRRRGAIVTVLPWSEPIGSMTAMPRTGITVIDYSTQPGDSGALSLNGDEGDPVVT